jgi:hypothetical protein
MSRRKSNAAKQLTPSGSEVRSEAARPLTQVAPSQESTADAALFSMIAEAAYYRAEQRGFAPGGEFEDWLAAEAEVTRSALQKQPASELH